MLLTASYVIPLIYGLVFFICGYFAYQRKLWGGGDVKVFWPLGVILGALGLQYPSLFMILLLLVTLAYTPLIRMYLKKEKEPIPYVPAYAMAFTLLILGKSLFV